MEVSQVMTNRITGVVAAIGLACLAPSLASANVISFGFSDDDSYSFDSHQYDIGDSGFFAGNSGGGSSIISLSRWYAGLPDYVTDNMRHHHPHPGQPGEPGTPGQPPSTQVAEPGTTALFGAGLLMAGFIAYRRRRVEIERK